MRRTFRPRTNPARKPSRELCEIAALMHARSRKRTHAPLKPIGAPLWQNETLLRVTTIAFVISTVVAGSYAALRSAFDFMP